MGINQVPIVNQYSDINRRLTEIEQGNRPESFCLPEGIWIISSINADNSLQGCISACAAI